MGVDYIQAVDQSAAIGNFISALQRPISKVTGEPVGEFKYKISNRAIFAKAKESAASSPLGLHYSHYILACHDDLPTEVNATITRVPF